MGAAAGTRDDRVQKYFCQSTFQRHFTVLWCSLWGGRDRMRYFWLWRVPSEPVDAVVQRWQTVYLWVSLLRGHSKRFSTCCAPDRVYIRGTKTPIGWVVGRTVESWIWRFGLIRGYKLMGCLISYHELAAQYLRVAGVGTIQIRLHNAILGRSMAAGHLQAFYWAMSLGGSSDLSARFSYIMWLTYITYIS